MVHVYLFWVFFSIFFMWKMFKKAFACPICSSFSHKGDVKMWRDMWLFTKADKTHITIGSGRQEAICLSCCYVKYMFIVHWKTHWKCAWKEKVSQQIISKENNPLSDPYSQQYLSLHIQKWYNGLFSSAAYK